MPKPNVREQLMEAGLRTLHSQGFNGCAVQDITQAAGVPKGSFYNHFESKEALALAALEMFWVNGTARRALREKPCTRRMWSKPCCAASCQSSRTMT